MNVEIVIGCVADQGVQDGGSRARSLPAEKKIILSPRGNCLEAPFQQCGVHGDAAVPEEDIQRLPAIQCVLGRLTQLRGRAQAGHRLIEIHFDLRNQGGRLFLSQLQAGLRRPVTRLVRVRYTNCVLAGFIE